ncbi:Fe-S oxidoreductase [Heliobacterium gestii]|uniref:Fe-S oxidoreductase n=1 Tax=Heliomicrobium gestii TaxID=2699 RepID=A0A845L9K4_HELGE|nr:(Fe-S)-binding protein [Heliomicrobium gestii]MBM7867856.1 L-lactate dehydrogenase complex protein LldE [Heliomicrobium gestii]MZP43332.1 Fe-S oxidoreductase [Heliomicrobium gestii]
MNVSLMITCLCDSFYPEVGEAVVRVLRRSGAQVAFAPEQVCCGQPAFNAGYHDDARRVARTFLRAFQDAEYVVSPSGSCAEMVRENFLRLFDTSPAELEQARRLSKKTYEFSEFLVKVLGVTAIGGRFAEVVTYHPSCHMTRLLGVMDEPLSLLRSINGLELKELPRAYDCCGFGGTFSVKMPEISEAIVTEKAENVLKSGAHLLVGADMGCLMNIKGRLEKMGHSLPVMHIAQVIDQAQGGR